MLAQVKTRSGSIYEIDGDENGGTWKRLEGPANTLVRTTGGIYHSRSPILLGQPMVLICPPLETGNVRLIETSDVVGITYEEKTTKEV